MIKMTYEEALKEAEERAKGFPIVERDGRKCIVVNEAIYPYDWFLRTCARMKANEEICTNGSTTPTEDK